MTTRYRFTIRPASTCHCPDGWVKDSITPLVPDQQWNYGTVDYDLPLTYRDAQHWSLDPDQGPRVIGVTVDGDSHSFHARDVLGGQCQEILYNLAVGTMTPDDLRWVVAQKSKDYEADIVIEIDENVDGRSLPLWREV